MIQPPLGLGGPSKGVRSYTLRLFPSDQYMVQHEVLHLLVVSAGVFTACLVYRVGCGVDGQQGGGEGLTWVAADKHGIRLFL